MLRQDANYDAEYDSYKRQYNCFAQHNVDDIAFGSAQGFQNTDLAGALHHSRVHGLKDHDEANHYRHPNHHFNKDGESGNILGRHH